MISKKAKFLFGDSVEETFSFEFEDGTTEEEINDLIKSEYDEWLMGWGCEWYLIEKNDDEDDDDEDEDDDDEDDEDEEEI